MKIKNENFKHFSFGLSANKNTPNAGGEKQKFFKFVIFFSSFIKGKIFDAFLTRGGYQLWANNRPQAERKKEIMKNKTLTLLLITIGLFSCQKKENIFTIYNKKTPEFIVKDTAISYQNRMESTPVVFKNKIYDVISNRQAGMLVDIFDENKSLVSTTKLGIGLASAMVYNDELYVTGSTNWSTTAPLKIYKTSDLITFVEVSSLLPAVGKRIFNSSLTHDTASFVLVTEEDDGGLTNFHPVIYKSDDMITWTKVSELKFTNYIACPTLRFINGEYYMFYLLTDKTSNLYYTSISKSMNLIDWEQSNKVVVAPENETEGQNASDMDLYELNGQVVINYVIGNQDSNRPEWSDIKKATYNGTMESFVKEFFK